MKTTSHHQHSLKVGVMGTKLFQHWILKIISLFPDQLQELRKVSLASILCENLDGVYMVQPDVFIAADPYLNSPVTCDVFPRLSSSDICVKNIDNLLFQSQH